MKGRPPKPTNATVRSAISTKEILAPLAHRMIPPWVLVPLRVFLGITFVYAGAQKLTDPQYFRPGAPGYIGKQIVTFATSSPFHGFLTTVALPHAPLFGGLVAWGELAIGLGTLAGVLLRPTAFFGLLINAIFFLSATWRVHPYFYGSDIVFIFGWLTLLLAGAEATGGLALDCWLAPMLLTRLVPESYQASVTRGGALLLGISPEALTYAGADLRPESVDRITAASRTTVPGRQASSGRERLPRIQPRITPAGRRSRYAVPTRTSRRDFLLGLAGGAAGAFVVGLIGRWWTGGGVSGGAQGGDSTPVATMPAGTAASGTSSAGVIAQASSVADNSAINFTLPSNGDPGVLVRLAGGQFVAYDATCTHAGCPVQFDPGSGLLICPCHGAEFDPAHGAAVVQGPAGYPLTTVSIAVDAHSGEITLSQ
jgi:thiosulfate dehydrogenase [quinone] large subunit